MRFVMFSALLLGTSFPVAAQLNPPVVEGAPARLAYVKWCSRFWSSFRCEKPGVQGTVARVTDDTVVVDLGQRHTGLIARLTTGQFSDSLVTWTPGIENMRLKMLVGHRSRTTQGLIGMGIGTAAGYAVGSVMGGLDEAFSCTAACDRNSHASWDETLVGAAVGGVAGLIVGLVKSNEIWKRVKG